MDHKQILDHLLKVGKITEEDIFEADSYIIGPMRRAIVERIHLACCKADHDFGKCGWYNEEQLHQGANPEEHFEQRGGSVRWSQPTHLRWVDVVLNIRKKLHISWDELDGLSRIISEGGLSERTLALLPELINLGPEALTEDTSGSSDGG